MIPKTKILTKKQIDTWVRSTDRGSTYRTLVDTLAAYAAIVDGIASINEAEDLYIFPDGNRFIGNCFFCGALSCEDTHELDCLYDRAKVLTQRTGHDS